MQQSALLLCFEQFSTRVVLYTTKYNDSVSVLLDVNASEKDSVGGFACGC